MQSFIFHKPIDLHGLILGTALLSSSSFFTVVRDINISRHSSEVCQQHPFTGHTAGTGTQINNLCREPSQEVFQSQQPCYKEHRGLFIENYSRLIATASSLLRITSFRIPPSTPLSRSKETYSGYLRQAYAYRHSISFLSHFSSSLWKRFDKIAWREERGNDVMRTLPGFVMKITFLLHCCMKSESDLGPYERVESSSTTPSCSVL
jgi:hypothetical protein